MPLRRRAALALPALTLPALTLAAMASPLATAGCATGPAPAGAPFPVSDHFDGRRFRNPDGEGPRSLADLLRWQFGEARAPWPDALPSPFAPDRPPAASGPLRVSFAGHASFLVQGAGLNILLDPVWAERASPLRFAGPRRRNPPGIPFDALPPIHAVLITHAHYDHLDTATLSRLWQRDRPLILAPLGNDSIIRGADPAIAVQTADWGATVPLGAGWEALMLPAHHWSARGVGDRNRALWCGYGLRGPAGTVFFAGDTGFDAGRPFRTARAALGPPDLALLPIGAYEPRWFMAPQHMNPEEAVRGFEILGARAALGFHWFTFPLTNEAPLQPEADLHAALDARGVARARFPAARPGQVWASSSAA